MADIELVIKIPEGLYNDIKSLPFTTLAEDIIINGTPLEKHDEEVIEETVESIWGKPPYTEMLDKIRVEIEQEPKIKVLDRDEVTRKLGTVDIYMASAWVTLIKDLEYLGLKICEVEA